MNNCRTGKIKGLKYVNKDNQSLPNNLQTVTWTNIRNKNKITEYIVFGYDQIKTTWL